MNSELCFVQMRGVKSKVYFKLTLHFPPLTTRPRNLDLRVRAEGDGCVRRNRSQLCSGATFLSRDTRHAAIRRTSRCIRINPRLVYKGEETLVKVFFSRSEIAGQNRPWTDWSNLTEKPRKKRGSELSVADRTSQSLKPTTEIGHVKGVSATRLWRTWRASALRVRTVCDKLIQITAVVRASCGKQSESYSRAIRFAF